MRVAIVSDVHANLRAFEAVLADLRRVAPDVVVHGGDLVYGGTHPAEIIDQIRALEWPGVRGNTDEMLWSPQSLASFAAKTPQPGPLLERIEDLIPPTVASIGEERLRWLEGFPEQYVVEGITLVHASPGDLWRAPMPNASRHSQRLLPVVDEAGQLMGVVTRGDLREPLAEHGDALLRRRLREFVRTDTVVAYPDEPLRVVVYRMAEKGFTRLT